MSIIQSDIMETIQVIIVEKSPLIRLGLLAVLKQIGYPFAFREVVHKEKIFQTLHGDHKNLLIISSSILNSCSPEITKNLSIKNKSFSSILIRDSELAYKTVADFNEIIEPDDNEKAIFRKLKKQMQILSKHAVSLNQSEEISDREKEVLQLVALGMTNKEIAEKLYISFHTVITHRKNITSKLGIKTIAGLTVYAVIHKLIASEELH